MYAHWADLHGSLCSPIFEHYDTDFPPIFIQAGTRELLLSDSVRLYHAMSAAGVQASFNILEGIPHMAAAAMAVTPEGATAIAKAAKFLTPTSTTQRRRNLQRTRRNQHGTDHIQTRSRAAGHRERL